MDLESGEEGLDGWCTPRRAHSSLSSVHLLIT